MTASVTIVNTSNHDEDVILDMGGKHVATLKRGESHKMGFGGYPLRVTATAQKPKGNEYLGELAVSVQPEKPVGPGVAGGLDFGSALAILKRGGRVQRKGWNGKDMCVCLTRVQGYDPCLTMRTAEGTYQLGWLASQADMLAEDWIEVEVDGFGGWKPKPFGDAVGYVS